MKSDGGIIYHEPAKALWTPRAFRPHGQRMAVRFCTWICDGNGKILRKGQEGWNTITDYGMDLLNSKSQNLCVNYLHLSSALGTSKRVLPGGTTLSIASTSDPTNLSVSASGNFFLSGDVGNTLYIDGLGQELKITGFTDAQNVTCATRAGVWLPTVTPSTGPFGTAGVHFTTENSLASDFYASNSFDTTVTNYNAELNDSANSRFIHQRIWLTGTVTSSWTINQIGWSDNGTVGGNVFGKVNLLSPDTVAIGHKYRVQLQFFSVYAPIDIASFSANWGPTIGTYDLQIREFRVPKDSTTGNFLKPAGFSFNRFLWWTSAFTLPSILWEGDAGYNIHPISGEAGWGGSPVSFDSAYSSGKFFKNRTVRLDDTLNLSGITGFVVDTNSSEIESIGFKPNSGTITKPSGYYADLIFPIYWTRLLVN